MKVNVLCERLVVLQNVQGFRKVDAEKWEFATEGFLRGQRHLLKTIRRRKTPPHLQASNQAGSDPCVEVGGFGLDAEIDRLRRDKQVLSAELVKLRQQQQNTKAYLKAMEQRLQVTEMKQQQMMTFMAKAVQNPSLLEQLVQQKERRKALQEAISNKRRRPIDRGPSYGFGAGESGQDWEANPYVKLGSQDYGCLTGYDDLGMNEQGLNMQESNQTPMHLVEDYVWTEAKSLDEGFWDGLIHEDAEDQTGYFGVKGEGAEDLDIN